MNEGPTAPPTSQSSTKIDPITAVQDSIDSLALSLFEALRGVRDAVAPESLDASSSSAAAATGNNNTTTTSAAAAAGGQSGVSSSSSAFREADELAENATAKERLLNGLNVDYFPPRAFDMLEPDYDAFILAYLSENVHAKELVRRYMATEAWKKRGDEVMMQQQRSRSSKSDDDVTNNNNNREDSSNNNNENDDTAVQIGDVGYEFRKQFDAGWYTGKVTEIILVGNMKNRRCHYNDGDVEDLSLDELKRLAKLDPDSKYYAKKPRLSIKLKVNKSKSSQDKENTNDDGGDGEDHQDDDNNSTSSTSKVRIPLTQEEYTQFLIDTEYQRDIQTTQRLAQTILNKSEQVDNLVAGLPGMHRTRDMQMERIEELLVRNHQVAKELDEAHVLAKERLQEVRKVLGETTFLALGVEEE